MSELPALIGIPYTRNGTSIAEGFDCFTLVRYVRAQFYGLPTPLSGEPAHTLPAIAAAMLGLHHATRAREGGALWQPCEPHVGCVVGLARTSLGRLHHCGVLTEYGVLHALETAGVMATPFARLHECYRQVECFECRG